MLSSSILVATSALLSLVISSQAINSDYSSFQSSEIFGTIALSESIIVDPVTSSSSIVRSTIDTTLVRSTIFTDVLPPTVTTSTTPNSLSKTTPTSSSKASFQAASIPVPSGFVGSPQVYGVAVSIAYGVPVVGGTIVSVAKALLSNPVTTTYVAAYSTEYAQTLSYNCADSVQTLTSTLPVTVAVSTAIVVNEIDVQVTVVDGQIVVYYATTTGGNTQPAVTTLHGEVIATTTGALLATSTTPAQFTASDSLAYTNSSSIVVPSAIVIGDSIPTSCDIDSDCGDEFSDLYCHNGICQYSQCESDSNCPYGQYCAGHFCLAPSTTTETTSTSAPTAIVVGDSAPTCDDSCGEDDESYCCNGACVPDTQDCPAPTSTETATSAAAPTSTSTCSVTSDCPQANDGTQYCSNGICVAGECNLDVECDTENDAVYDYCSPEHVCIHLQKYPVPNGD